MWDLRTFKPLHSYFSRAPAEWCDISQRGVLAVGWGRKVSVWRDALARKQAAPYLSHNLLGGALRDFHFCPYEVGSSCSRLGSAVCWKGLFDAAARHAINKPLWQGQGRTGCHDLFYDMLPNLHCTQPVQDFMAVAYCSGLSFVLWHRGGLNVSS